MQWQAGRQSLPIQAVKAAGLQAERHALAFGLIWLAWLACEYGPQRSLSSARSAVLARHAAAELLRLLSLHFLLAPRASKVME